MSYECEIVDKDDNIQSRNVKDIPVHSGSMYTTFDNFEEGILQGDLDGDGEPDFNGTYVKPLSLNLNMEEKVLGFADMLELNASVEPAGASQTVYWYSSDTKTAYVDKDGIVTAVGTGSAEITAVSSEDPGVSAVCRITVSEEAISVSEAKILMNQESYEYTGNPINPDFEVSYQGIELMEGMDYTVLFENNIFPGTATAKLSGCGLFKGTASLAFEITAAPDITVEKKVEQLMEKCIASGADSEDSIALWFHDWLITHADYDYTLTEYDADGVLLKGKGVCQSYTLAYKALLDQAGIENMVISAPEMDHAWNIAKINGSWTHIDCTWDDPNYGGRENRSYFGLSDSDMGKDHTWNRADYPRCSAIVHSPSYYELPEPDPLGDPVEGIDFVLADTSGKTLTRENFKTGNTLLIFGRSIEDETLEFINELVLFKDVIKKNNLNVLLVFEDEEQAAQSAGQVPFTCTYSVDTGYAKWDFLDRVGVNDYYEYPLVVLQNPQGYAFYYSTGYVYEPKYVLAAAVQKLPVTEELNAVPLEQYKNSKELKDILETALEERRENLKICNPDAAELSQGDFDIISEIVEQYCRQNNITCGYHCNYYGNVAIFTFEYQNEEITEHTHVWSTIPAVEATCMNSGLTEGSFCSVCGLISVPQQIIPAAEHKWSEWETISEATIEKPERQRRTCRVCGKYEEREYGNCLTATANLSTSSILLKAGQSADNFFVSGMARGDYVKSWKSSNPKIVKVSGKQDGTCRLTAQKKAGKAKITIKLYSGLKETLNVTVQKEVVRTKSIKGIAKNVTMKKGKTLTLHPVISPAASQDKVTFKSSNKKVAVVNAKGVVRAKKAGTAKITVKSGKKKVVCKIKVKK